MRHGELVMRYNSPLTLRVLVQTLTIEVLEVATNQQSHGSKCAMFCHLGPVPSGCVVMKLKPCLHLLGSPSSGARTMYSLDFLPFKSELL